MAVAVTTVRLEKTVKARLDSFRNFDGESYSTVVLRLINSCSEDDPLSDSEISQIRESLDEIKAGKVLPWKTAKKEWGV